MNLSEKVINEALPSRSTLADDPKWVKSGLEYWKKQLKKNPHSKKIKDQVDQFQKWASEHGLK